MCIQVHLSAMLVPNVLQRGDIPRWHGVRNPVGPKGPHVAHANRQHSHCKLACYSSGGCDDSTPNKCHTLGLTCTLKVVLVAMGDTKRSQSHAAPRQFCWFMNLVIVSTMYYCVCSRLFCACSFCVVHLLSLTSRLQAPTWLVVCEAEVDMGLVLACTPYNLRPFCNFSEAGVPQCFFELY